ncbi:(4Fe-4S)-binding protein [Exiguobacterium sp. SL14]|nr:(4Fe-4S)-binding protein [Exiguobacterium sp. SL14]MCY1691697.1 (4Fe-4S)-binding protein [Exiguobacterium sp. SL14]
MKKGYEGKEITVYFDSEVCIHSGHCVRSLPTVFDVKRRPWIEADGAPSRRRHAGRRRLSERCLIIRTEGSEWN